MPPKDPPANNHLLALGTAAVLAVFGAGFVRTQAAAERIEGASRRRHPAAPVASPQNSVDVSAAAPVAPVPSEHAASATTEHAAPDSPKPAHIVAELPAKSETDPATSPTTSAPQVKAKTDPKPDTATAAAAAEVIVIRPTPAAPDTALTRAAAEAPLGAARDLKDGIYAGWGTSRHGDIESRVEIKNGRIISASIAQCLTMYSVYWIAALPPQVVKRQSPEVDVISGATESSNAFYDGVVQALKKAK